MFNFSANNLFLKNRLFYDKATLFIFIDKHTNRTYKLYDYSKKLTFENDIPYCISGKINSANDKIYLIIESAKTDKKNASDIHPQ